MKNDKKLALEKLTVKSFVLGNAQKESLLGGRFSAPTLCMSECYEPDTRVTGTD